MNPRPQLLVGEDLPSAPKQKRSIGNRARLKAAALACFGEKGYEGASIEEIARRAHLAAGGFYLHFRSKRQLLLVLMDEFLDQLSQLDLRPRASSTDIRTALREMLARAFSHDLEYLGAVRAWQEAALSDSSLAAKQIEIRAWTTARVLAVFQALQKAPGARAGVDLEVLARIFDGVFWSILGDALHMGRAELNRWLDCSVHLIEHALFDDGACEKI